MIHTHLGDAVVVEGPAGAALLRDAGDINDVIGECFGAHTTLALLYGENLPPAFFDVSSRQAGEILQKLRNYGLRLAVVVAPRSAAAFMSCKPPNAAMAHSRYSTRAMRRWCG